MKPEPFDKKLEAAFSAWKGAKQAEESFLATQVAFKAATKEAEIALAKLIVPRDAQTTENFFVRVGEDFVGARWRGGEDFKVSIRRTN